MKDIGGFHLLVQRYIEGLGTALEIEQLNSRLRDDPEARQWFIEMLNLDSTLTAIAADWGPDEGDAPVSVTPVSVTLTPSQETREAAREPVLPKVRLKSIWRRCWIAAMAVCLAIVIGVWTQTTQRGFATVYKSAGVETLAGGMILRGDRHEIRAGTVELVTARGVRVVIEAPAEFRLESAQRLHLTRGRLFADVPKSGIGFTVVTAAGKAVDFGTTFGIDVLPDRGAEIHVFEGEVVAQSSAGDQRQNLKGGEAFRQQFGAGSPRGLRSAAFIRSEEVSFLRAALLADHRTRSKAAWKALRRDPALIAMFDFESEEIPAGRYRIVQGRWPGSRAAEFVEMGDHKNVDVGGDRRYPELTLAAWVRLDRMGEPNQYQSLLHTNDWSSLKPGQVHWMVTYDGTTRLALYGNRVAPGSRTIRPESRTNMFPEEGRWVHLAVVYDSNARTARFHLNGEFDGQTRLEVAHPARLGPAQFGNWNAVDRKLSGRIDDLVILGRAMTDEEVHSLFVAGDPYG